MPRVIRNKPNGSSEISGVKFFPLEDGRLISDEIDDETAELFCSVPGYSLDDGEEEVTPPAPKPAPAPKLTKSQQKAADKAAGKKAADKAPANATAPAPEVDAEQNQSDANDQTGNDDGQAKGDGITATDNTVF